jgi:hypothetical protein
MAGEVDMTKIVGTARKRSMTSPAKTSAPLA